MSYQIAVNTKHKNKHPHDLTDGDKRRWFGWYNGEFANKTLAQHQIIAAIKAGYGITTQHKDYRKADNFIAGQHIGIDIDDLPAGYTLQNLAESNELIGSASFIYTTPSHTPEAPKMRAIWLLDRPIADRDKYTLLATALTEHFQIADSSCKDACRLFFGSEGCEVLNLGHTLTLEEAASLIVNPYKERQAEQARIAAEKARNITVVSSNEAPQRLIQAHISRLLANVTSAPDGQKYTTLRDTAIVMGGYVASGYYSRFDASQWLQNAISANGNNVRDLRHAFSAIEESLTYGEARPLHFEVNEQLNQIQPPLDDSQRQQVQAIIAATRDLSFWRGYHEGMTEQQRRSWNQVGMLDSAIDWYGLGYCDEIINPETGEIITNALTVPYRDAAGNIVNIEYTHSDGVSYDGDDLPFFYTEVPEHETTIITDNCRTAINTYLNYGTINVNVVGLPAYAINERNVQEVKDSNLIVVVSPDFKSKGSGLHLLRDRAKFLRLPHTVNAMVRYGMDADNFSWLLKQAKVLA